MDIGASRAAVDPWVALGVVLGIAALLLTGVVALAVARRRTVQHSAVPPAGRWTDDDLPGFLETPPGSAERRRGDAVVPLAVPPPRPGRPAPPSVRTVALGAAALLLLATVVVAGVAAAVPRERPVVDRGGHGDRGPAHRPAGGDRSGRTVEARLTFEGIVLEEHAVGVTVAYPELRLDGGVAALTLPTWNCLAREAPADPVAAGCAAGRTEYADLAAPDLVVTRTPDGLRLQGEFATSTRSSAGVEEPTGHSYRLRITVTADDPGRAGRRTPASGELELGDDRRAGSVDGELRLDR